MGDTLNGYELLHPFQNKNAGFSRWTFAKKNGRDFFIKEFLNPVYPDETSLSDGLRRQRIAICQSYEQQLVRVFQTINQVSDGNLVRIHDFFRYDSHYYIVMPRITASSLSPEELSDLPFHTKALLCRTAAHSLMQMHNGQLVHGDIKDTNVLIQQTATGMLSAKLVDCDSSFFEYAPPKNGDDLIGDQVYLSPESCLFICGEDIKLTCKSDVFSMGLLFHQFLTGHLPAFDLDHYDYAHEAVLDDKPLGISEKLPPAIRTMLKNMLIADPEKRYSIRQAFDVLGAFFDTSPIHYAAHEVTRGAVPAGGENPFFRAAGDL